MKALLVCLFCFIHLDFIKSSHFRGGIIMWEPTGKRNEILITFRVSWRRSFNEGTHCDANTKLKNQLIGSDTGDMVCLQGCRYGSFRSNIIGSMRFYCTDFSDQEDWTSGESTLVYTFPESSNHFYQFGFTGNAWIGTIRNGGGNWELRTTASLTIRNDTGKMNSSPKTVMQPIIRLQHGCNHTITIPVSDPDNDDVRCRWATSDRSECGGICNSFRGAEMHERECIISYSPNWIGWFAAAVQIEDFNSTESLEALSSVSLQFLVVVFQATTKCASKPTFVEPSRIGGSCIGIPFNTTYFDQIVSRSGSPNVRIREIQTASPQGMVESRIDLYDEREWYVNISWTPGIGQAGPHLFCFTALDSNGANSDTICVKLLVGVSPPNIVEVNPVGDVFPNHNIWTIKFDKQFERPNRTTYMYFQESDTDAVVYKIDISTSRDAHYPRGAIRKTLTVHTSFVLTEKKHYYVKLDPGAGRGKTEYCKVESEPIRNKTFWGFRIRDVTKPELSIRSGTKASNGSITISWTFNENVTSRCTIVKPDATEKTNCTNYWSGDNLKEGFYTLFIFGTDLEGNQADVGRYEFQIDTTPPDVFINNNPHPKSKTQQITFDLSCNENCRIYCSLYQEGSSAKYSNCYLPSTTFKLNDDTAYIFVVKAVDGVGNVGNNTFYRFRTDFTPPLMTQLKDQTLKCGADFNPNITGIPNVTDNSPNGTNIVYTDSVANNCGIKRTWTKIIMNFTPPLMTQLKDQTLKCGADFNPNITGIPNVTDNSPNGTNIVYTDSVANNCGIKRTWTVTDAAGNEASQIQTILFESPTPIRLLFAKEAVVACGDIDEFTKGMKQFISKHVKHPCGIPFKRIYYTDLNILNNCGITINRMWHLEDSCGSITNGTQQIKILQMEVPVTPKNGQLNVELQSTLRWPSYPKANKYEIYLWLYGQEKPKQPFTIQWYTYWTTPNLIPNTKYSWQVEIDIGQNDTIPSPKWSFKTRKVPDLTVESVVVQRVAFSGQSFVVQWTVRNIGSGITDTPSWYDYVYYSFTDSLADAKRLGHSTYVRQRNILFSNDGYTSQTKVTLQKSDIGLLRVFVVTGYYDYNRTNNDRASDHRVDVKLTPPPDLQVDSIIIPDTTYSGTSLDVIFTVRNHGDGATIVDSWIDDIYWSDDEILVHCDSSNTVYEHGMDENNKVFKTIPVTLTPPPDLTIMEILTEKTHYSTGDIMVIKWIVNNNGYRSPYAFYWRDVVKLNSLAHPEMYYYLGQQTYNAKLEPNMSYTRSIPYTIPANILSGTYNVSVTTDYYNQVYEFQNEGNNILNKEITIQKSLPDLFVKNMTVELKSNVAFNKIRVSWKVQNIGEGKTLISRWTDTLSAVIVSNYGSKYTLGQFYGGSDHRLSHNKSYVINQELVLPPYVYGKVYFLINIDYFSQTADDNSNNNIKITPIVNVPLKSPDLYIYKLNVISDEVYSGSPLEIECSIGNRGVSIKSNQRWFQTIIISSTNSQYTDIVSERSVQYGPLTSEQISHVTISLQIPKSVHGKVYLHCIVDTMDDIFEGREPIRLENNHKRFSLFVYRPPSPDLLISFLKVSLVNSSSSHTLVSLTWSVRNTGNTMPFRSSWLDAVGISHHNNLHMSDVVRHLEILGTFEIMYGLEPSGSYSISKTVVIPKHYMGVYYMYIVADYENNIFEFNGEENNIAFSSPIVIPPIPMPKLKVMSFLISEHTVTPGSSIDASFRIENIGSVRTRLTSWEDLVYMLSEQHASKQDILNSGYLLSTTVHVGALYPGEIYLTNVSIIIPKGVNNKIFLYILSVDNAETGSVVDLNSQVSLYYFYNKAISIDNENLPNLVVSANESMGVQKGGQPLLITYFTTNNGAAATSRVFYNSFYLSEDYLLDAFDLKLKTKYYSEPIALNETVNDTISVILPYDLKSRNYFIIIEVDSGNSVYEMDEVDNEFVISMSIEQTLSTDVAVVDVESTKSVSYGDNLQIRWKLRNNGTKHADGYACDSVFLSSDRKWDIDDMQIGQTSCRFITLQPYHQLVTDTDKDFSLTGKIPELSEASYVAVVKSRSNILDKNLENNVGFSDNGTYIKVKHLPLNTTVKISIGTDNAQLLLYYI
ncbi:uncharacterized protein LOC143066264 [Mytilus galloprovincialis]|uniref:uncharacterized protein LOC143066264 n=1 Tax=Mytilus galloprovincialis TaxID=29158 RepID=UPI003F7BB139